MTESAAGAAAEPPAEVSTPRKQAAAGDARGGVRGFLARYAPALWLFLAVVLPGATFYHGTTDWNVNTRLALVFAIVDQQTVSIDFYHDLPPYQTDDKALYKGRYYSDKIIGHAVLGLPAYAVLSLGAKLIGADVPFALANGWTRFWGVTVPAGLLVLLLWRRLRSLGLPGRPAGIISLLLYYGTLMFPYAMLYYPYVPGLLYAMLAWEGIDPAREPGGGEDAEAGTTGRWRRFLAHPATVGGLLGLTMLMDYIFGIAVAAIGLRALWKWYARGGVAGLVAAMLKSGGAFVVPLAVFAVYCKMIFGSFSVPYQYEANEAFRTYMAQGFMGVRRFQPAALYYLTVHPLRGLFVWSPVLAVCAAAGVGWLVWGRRAEVAAGEKLSAVREREKYAAWLGLLLLIGYLAFNSSYYMWWGGWSMGSRFLLPAIPFVCLGAAFAWRLGSGWRAALWASLVGSVAMTLPSAVVGPATPMYFHEWDALLDPVFNPKEPAPQFVQWMYFGLGYFNSSLGNWLGIRGIAGLIPSALLAFVPAFMFLRWTPSGETGRE